MSQADILDEIRLGYVQVAIERRVKNRNISMLEWNLKTERVNKVLGDLLWHRDHLIKRIETRANHS